MHTGRISKLFQDEQYGKIKTSDGKEAHFHKDCLWDTPFESLGEGLEVEFEMQSAYHGFLAFHIRPCVGAENI
ncbi:MAG: cold shock domain-containing protein [Candidatus Omnitrophota bacterium]